MNEERVIELPIPPPTRYVFPPEANVRWSDGRLSPGARKARRRVVRETVWNRLWQLQEAIREIDDGEPHSEYDVLQESINIAYRLRDALAILADSLVPGTHIFDSERDEVILGLWGPDHLGDQAPNVVVTMLGEWTDRCARLAKTALEVGLAERRLALDEAQAQRVAQAFRELVRRLDLTPEQEELFPAASRAALDLVTDTTATDVGRPPERAQIIPPLP